MRSQIIRDGYDPDSTLFIASYYKKGEKETGVPYRNDIYDGDTRWRSVSDVDSIEMLPCRVIKFEEGN